MTMKNIFKSAMLLLCGVCLFASCDDDLDSNPTLRKPTSFILNTPALAPNAVYDLNYTDVIRLTCSQPDYGFTVTTRYTIDVATKADMSNAQTYEESFTNAEIKLSSAFVAPMITNMLLEEGKTEKDFPLTLPVYMRATAEVVNSAGNVVEGTAIQSNIVTLNNVRLGFSLPPVNLPKNIYLVGNFCGWDWGNSLSCVRVHSSDNIMWHMVYIDDSGIKFNTNKAWDGGEVGFNGIRTIGGDCASDIIDSGGNIASSNPGWYLMIISSEVVGRDVVYDVQFNRPEVWLIGSCTKSGAWDECMAEELFTVPTTADGEFVSPAFGNTVPGGDGDGVRAHVKIPSFDWWKSEFIIFDGKIEYRGQGDDQDRVAGNAGQHLYLNFTKETGEIKN